MVESDCRLRRLRERRQELVDQLYEIDKAIENFTSPGASISETLPVSPRSIQPRRVMSDAHKAAVSAGKRRSLVAKDIAKGLSREMPDDSFVPAIKIQAGRQQPRLVKRSVKK
jgi:hypothetical protein